VDKNRFEHAKRIIHKMEPLQIDNRAAANSTYPKGGFSRSKESFAINITLVFQIKFFEK